MSNFDRFPGYFSLSENVSAEYQQESPRHVNLSTGNEQLETLSTLSAIEEFYKKNLLLISVVQTLVIIYLLIKK